MINIEKQLEQTDIQKYLRTDHPLVREFEFISTNAQRSTSKHADIWEYGEAPYHFAIGIHLKPGVTYWQQRDERGDRIEPVKRVTTGTELVGQGNRVLLVKDGEICAENSTFFPDQRYNDLGIGSAFYVAQERLYRALGVRYVRLFAAAVGRYVWARQGFKFVQTDQARSLGTTFRAFLRACDIPANGQFRESWDLVNYHVSGAERDGDRIGKFFALKTFPCWEGFTYLDEQDHRKVAIASREETFSRLPEKIVGAPDYLVTI